MLAKQGERISWLSYTLLGFNHWLFQRLICWVIFPTNRIREKCDALGCSGLMIGPDEKET
jgi:hypothetical protein